MIFHGYMTNMNLATTTRRHYDGFMTARRRSTGVQQSRSRKEKDNEAEMGLPDGKRRIAGFCGYVLCRWLGSCDCPQSAGVRSRRKAAAIDVHGAGAWSHAARRPEAQGYREARNAPRERCSGCNEEERRIQGYSHLAPSWQLDDPGRRSWVTHSPQLDRDRIRRSRTATALASSRRKT